MMIQILFLIQLTFAQTSGKCGKEKEDCSWIVDEELGKLTLKGEGKMEDYFRVYEQPWANYSHLIKTVEIEGLKRIGERAFMNFVLMKELTIPDCVKSIGGNVCRGCTSLQSIRIPESVEDIGSAPFARCSSLELIEVDVRNKNYTSENGVLYSKDIYMLIQYPLAHKRKIYMIHTGVRLIHDFSFQGAVNLKKIVLPKTVERIEMYAFSGCTSLKTITIPSSVKKIHLSPFHSCTLLENIIVDENNEDFTSVDGVLYDKKQTKLIQYPLGKTDTTYTIPSTVEVIGDCAFESSPYLEKMNIPCSVIVIRQNAFASSLKLKEVILPSSLKEIEANAFTDCLALESVKYVGNSQPDFCQNDIFGTSKQLKGVTVKDTFEEDDFCRYNIVVGEVEYPECENVEKEKKKSNKVEL